MEIAWLQVILAFLAGVLLSAMVKGLVGTVRSKAGV